MAVVMSVLNYFSPITSVCLFLKHAGDERVEMRQYIVTGILPFNIVKGL